MKFVADLHLHSKYSRAVSGAMTLPNMAKWAKYKGISVLATSDFTHPFWLEQLKNELEDTGNGLFKLKQTAVSGKQSAVSDVSFLLSCEVSSIYSQGGKGRRIHNLFFFPSFDSVDKFIKELLRRRANLRADGRPIVGISARDLANIALLCDDKALIIPAHIWTPWFSVFGSFSGFDSIEECFGDMAQYIYGIETGLSSDPFMNWQIGDLDSRTILSFSDAHSLPKMGREATVFEANEVSYDCIYRAICRDLDNSENSESQKVRISGKSDNQKVRQSEYSDNPRIAFTIEFYPEEGKYHFTGHRDCNFSQSPEESRKNGDICPVCHRPLTVGVMHRVEDLKTRDPKLEIRNQDGVRWNYFEDNKQSLRSSASPAGLKRPPYVSCVPLYEIIAEALGVAPTSKKVEEIYITLINALGSEFSILMKSDVIQIARFSSQKVADGISRVRSGNIVVEPGYDGKFGVVKIWNESGEAGDVEKEDVSQSESQLNLFA
ncbi:MAG: endonuclease Q family protein [Candidatus Curtissbacteria bacterium]|nr:endonuclease Q family protein [Candidatus Curtissbacteria bacterium]